MKRFSIIILLVVFCLVAGDVLAETLYVDNTKPDICSDTDPDPIYYCTIQAAIDATAPSDTIYVIDGTYTENLTITKSIGILGETGNTIVIDGGGNDSTINISGDSKEIDLINITIQNGSAATTGGGISFTGTNSSLTIYKTLIQNNTAFNGGGIYVASTSSTANILNTTLTGNNAENGGAAVYNSGVTILNHVTVSENNSNSDGDETSSAGATYNTLTGTLTIQNSIASNNTGIAGISPDCTGTLTSGGYNLISQTNGGCTITATTGDNFGTMESPVDPLLYPLADNDGDSYTYALQANSPAIDVIPEVSCALEEDQRGFDRPVNDACDMGAYESGLCGDGVIDAAETCDDGNASGGDGCSALCQIEECGNGTVDPGESCDDGNSDESDSCLNDCSLPVCGDGIVSGTEECDDGNTTNGDGCNDECVVEDIVDDSDDSTDDDIIDDSSEEETEESSDQEATPAQSDIDAVSSSGCALVSSGSAGFGGFAMMFFGLFGLVSLRFWAQGSGRKA